MAEPSGPVLGVLEKALSRRGGFLAAGGAGSSTKDAFDNKQVLPHLAEDTLHGDVTSSSSEAMASVLYFASSSGNNYSTTSKNASVSLIVYFFAKKRTCNVVFDFAHYYYYSITINVFIPGGT